MVTCLLEELKEQGTKKIVKIAGVIFLVCSLFRHRTRDFLGFFPVVC